MVLFIFFSERAIDDDHVNGGEIVLFTEYITENSNKPHVCGEPGTLKPTKPPKP